MSKKVFLVLLILLCASFTYAEESLDVQIELIANDFSLVQGTNQFAEYGIKLTNPYSYEDTFEFRVKDFSWNIWTNPLSDYVGGGVDVQPGETYEVQLFIAPTGTKNIGRYSIPLTITTRSNGEKIQKNLVVDIVSGVPTIKEYELGILVNVDLPSVIDPRGKTTLVVDVENVFPRNITNIKLELISELIRGRSNFSLGRLGEETLEFPIELNDYQSPLQDKLELRFSKDDEVFKSVKVNYAVLSYSIVNTVSDETYGKFLKSTRVIEVHNDGNIAKSHQIRIPLKFGSGIFTRTDPKNYLVKDEEGTFMVWDLNLDSQAKSTVTINQNYQVLFWFGVVIILIGLFYWFMRSPVLIAKEAKVVEIRDGAVSQLKVLLHLRNRTNKPITAIKIADRVPDIAQILEEFDVGTIRPEKIVRDSKGGTLIKWSILKLDPYEERIISYKLRSKLQVLGSFVLPSALVKFKSPGGSNLKSKSKMGKINQ